MADINLGVGGANSAVAGGYDIDNSLKLEADNSEELNFTPSSSGSNQTWTFSCWFKLTEIDKVNPIFGHYTSADNQALIRILNTNNELSFRLVNGGIIRELKSDMLFRDTSAFYHLVVAVDTTDGTSTNRVKIYVNGEQISLTGTYPTPSLVTYGINTSGINMDIGGSTTATPTFYGFTGYMAEIHHIDGSQLAPTEFGEYDEDSGIWKPKAYTGSHGTNGFYLDFADASDLGDDESGNGNDWTEVNLTAADQATDTPTNNFATYNVLVNNNTTETEGATRINSDSSFQTVPASIGVTSGKWYAEFKHNETGNEAFFGVVSLDGNNTDFGNHIGNDSDNYGVGMYAGNGNSYITGTIASFSSATSSSVVVGIALDMDNGYVYISKDGTWQNSGDPTSGSSGTGGLALAKYQTDIHAIAASCFNVASQYYVASNFGGYTTISISSAASDANGYGTFEYAPPSGYYALCTKNLAEYG
jgi:hypothetical protein